MTKIEEACFVSTRAHWVASMSYRDREFAVVLHPSDDETKRVTVTFSDVSLMRFDTSYNDEEMPFPWDIIGFDSEPLQEGRWAFTLHTDMIEFSFRAGWPRIERVE
jgi:hypothetical protein